MATEKRLIDANALLTEVVKAQALEPNKAVAKIIMLITEAEKVDAVEVPCRCKDCKHWKHIDHVGCSDLAKVCMLANYMIGGNGYCLYGERKTE